MIHTTLDIDMGEVDLVFFNQTRLNHTIKLRSVSDDGQEELTELKNGQLYGALCVHEGKLRKKWGENSLHFLTRRENYNRIVRPWAGHSLSQYLEDLRLAEDLSRVNFREGTAGREVVDDKTEYIRDYLSRMLAYPETRIPQ